MKKILGIVICILALALCAYAAAEGTEITEVELTFGSPAAGSLSTAEENRIPDFVALGGETYTVEAGCWCHEDGSWSEVADLEEYAFTAGKTYKFWVTLKANEGYVFSDSCAMNVNGTRSDGSEYEKDIYTFGTYSALVAILSVTVQEEPAPPDPGPDVPETVTVTFNGNGGKGAMDGQTAEKGTQAALAPNAFTRKGYVFTGWATKKTGKGTTYRDGQKITFEKDMTLYAQWAKINLVLKSVTVKKSASGLTLSATLKLNGKSAKGETVTFTFNGKKYTAKTDKKGVAEVKIKKSVLKKLTVGKKITVSASFGDVKISRKVKVKK